MFCKEESPARYRYCNPWPKRGVLSSSFIPQKMCSAMQRVLDGPSTRWAGPVYSTKHQAQGPDAFSYIPSNIMIKKYLRGVIDVRNTTNRSSRPRMSHAFEGLKGLRIALCKATGENVDEYLYRSRQLGRDRLPRPVLSLKQALL